MPLQAFPANNYIKEIELDLIDDLVNVPTWDTPHRTRLHIVNGPERNDYILDTTAVITDPMLAPDSIDHPNGPGVWKVIRHSDKPMAIIDSYDDRGPGKYVIDLVDGDINWPVNTPDGSLEVYQFTVINSDPYATCDKCRIGTVHTPYTIVSPILPTVPAYQQFTAMSDGWLGTVILNLGRNNNNLTEILVNLHIGNLASTNSVIASEIINIDADTTLDINFVKPVEVTAGSVYTVSVTQISGSPTIKSGGAAHGSFYMNADVAKGAMMLEAHYVEDFVAPDSYGEIETQENVLYEDVTTDISQTFVAPSNDDLRRILFRAKATSPHGILTLRLFAGTDLSVDPLLTTTISVPEVTDGMYGLELDAGKFPLVSGDEYTITWSRYASSDVVQLAWSSTTLPFTPNNISSSGVYNGNAVLELYFGETVITPIVEPMPNKLIFSIDPSDTNVSINNGITKNFATYAGTIVTLTDVGSDMVSIIQTRLDESGSNTRVLDESVIIPTIVGGET